MESSNDAAENYLISFASKVSCKGQKVPRKNLNQDTSPARDSKPGPPENAQYCTHTLGKRSIR